MTPPLHGGPYTFPVAGNRVIYGDTYGAHRSDVPGGWHHGDDIFAPLGTPVVAVADGTLNRVGWEKLGGWRLWVRDKIGDEFYYAHLSGYSPLALWDGRVRRGEVIGFIGNTGDAFTTLPHLHFEVHPSTLLHLGYGGAVDPTGYLETWQRPGHVSEPSPVHPGLPLADGPRHEAVENFRELLATREHRTTAPPIRAPGGSGMRALGGNPSQPVEAQAAPASGTSAATHHSGSLQLWIAVVAGLVLLNLVLLIRQRRRRASRAQAQDAADDTPSEA